MSESTWQPAHPAGRTSPTPAPAPAAVPAPARQPTSASTSGPLVTHQVVIGTSEPGLADLAHQPDEDGHQRAGGRERMLDAFSLLRFFSESPGSLRDQIEFAEEGAYTGRPDGVWRTANIWYARTVAFIGLTVCYLLAWSLFTRLSRFLTAIPVFLLALWALNQLPVTAWIVWDGLDFTTWLVPAEVGDCSVPWPGE